MDIQQTFRIFLVDNEIFSLNLYQQLIKNAGYHDLKLFQNGTQCLDNLHLNPDLIFLDINMGQLNGLEVLIKIKRCNPNIHVVMLSGQDNLKTVVDCLKYGAFDYLIKGDQEEDKIAKVLYQISKLNGMPKPTKASLLKRLFFQEREFERNPA